MQPLGYVSRKKECLLFNAPPEQRFPGARLRSNCQRGTLVRAPKKKKTKAVLKHKNAGLRGQRRPVAHEALNSSRKQRQNYTSCMSSAHNNERVMHEAGSRNPRRKLQRIQKKLERSANQTTERVLHRVVCVTSRCNLKPIPKEQVPNRRSARPRKQTSNDPPPPKF